MKPDLESHQAGVASARSCQLRDERSGEKTLSSISSSRLTLCKLNINQHTAGSYEVFQGTLTGSSTSDYSPGKRQGKLEMKYSLR